jgi:hypothetical protein
VGFRSSPDLLEPTVPESYASTTLYRNGVRTPAARQAHAQSAARQRRTILLALFPPAVRSSLLANIRARMSVRAAAEEERVTYQAVYALAQIDEAFREALDQATLVGCVCNGGGSRRYERGGRRCDCPAAREYRMQEARAYRERQRAYVAEA